MRKFFVVICGMLMVGGALAHPDRYKHPVEDSTYASEWKVNGTYDKNLPQQDNSHPENVYRGFFLNKYICPKDEGTKKTTSTDKCIVTHDDVGIGGTYDDEGAIVLALAREVYQNGATFCITQIQVANINGRQYVWLDYYSDEKMNASCKTYCKPGYDPDNKCEAYTGTKCQDITEYPFDVSGNTIIKSGGATGNFTEEMNVFGYKNETGGGTNNQPAGNQLTKHTVLGIIAKDTKNGKGIKVAPLEITGKRDKTGSGGIQSWIYSIKHNGNITTLCPQGYAPDSNNVCKLGTACADLAAPAKAMCADYINGYSSTDHEYKKNGDCWEYRCKLSGYGFKSSTDKTCEQCGTDLRYGALEETGVCTTCDVGQCFKNGKCGDCNTIPKLKIERGPKYDTENR